MDTGKRRERWAFLGTTEDYRHPLEWRVRSLQDGTDGVLGWPSKGGLRAPPVTELYQNPMYLTEKGFDFERKQKPRNGINQ